MDIVISLLERLGQAGISLLLNPFYYISILIVIWHMRRQIYFERRLYHSRLHSLVGDSVRTIVWGLVAGIFASLIMGIFGASLLPLTVTYLWVGALLLALIRVRFLCFAYVIGCVGIVHGVLHILPEIEPSASWYVWLEPVMDVHMPSLLVLAGIIHIAEALLVRIQGSKLATPVFIEGKRGKLIGSWQFQGLWPVPVLLLVPSTAGGQAVSLTPLFGGEGLWAAGGMFLALPFMIGFTNMTVSMGPDQKVRRSALHLLGYGIVITGLGTASEWLPVLVLPASVLAIALHEMVIWLDRSIENKRSPIYVHTERGLTVLAVLPNSVAKAMGIQPGEMIHKVNGQPVKMKEQLHQALRLNSAFARLDVIDHNGEHRFVQSALFEGDHHHLGIILSPDDDAQFYVQLRRFQMFRRLRSILGKRYDYTGQTDQSTMSG